MIRSMGRIIGVWKDYSVDRIGVVRDGFLGRRTIDADQRGLREEYQPIFHSDSRRVLKRTSMKRVHN